MTGIPKSNASTTGLCCKRPRRELHEEQHTSTSGRRYKEHVDISTSSSLMANTQTLVNDSTATQEGPLTWGCHATIGLRPYMEDAYVVAPLALGENSASLLGIFDGHGGSTVAEFLSANAPLYIQRELSKQQASTDSDDFSNASSTSDDNSSNCLKDAASGALREAFLSLDRDVPTRASKEMGGSTAVCVIVNDEHIVCANCGDSRAILARRDGIVPLSDDHKPERRDEQDRIQRAGGRIINNGGLRVMGMLSMTRAIGDTPLQRFGISPEPEIKVLERTSFDDFVILASDGLWGAMSNEEAVRITRRCLERSQAKSVHREAAFRIAAKVLAHAAMRIGSRDNITVVVVDMVQDRSASLRPRTPPHQPQQQLSKAPSDELPADSSETSSEPFGAAQGQQSLHGQQQEHRFAAQIMQRPEHQMQMQMQQRMLGYSRCSGLQLLSAENLLVHVPLPCMPSV